MPDIKFGKKVVCTNCEAKFYDLNRKPAICPHCGTEYVDPLNETIAVSYTHLTLPTICSV